jgi:hypothetical protein
MLRANLIVDVRGLGHTSTSTVRRLIAMAIQSQVYRVPVRPWSSAVCAGEKTSEPMGAAYGIERQPTWRYSHRMLSC